MNRFNFKNRIAPLLLGFSLFFIEAADKDALEKQLNITTAPPAGKNDSITRSGPERKFVTKTELILVLGHNYSKLLRLIRPIPRCKLDGWIFDTLRFRQSTASLEPGRSSPRKVRYPSRRVHL